MQYGCGRRRPEHVFACLQTRGFAASTGLGCAIPADAVFVAAGLQLLVGDAIATDCAYLGPAELSRVAARQGVLPGAAALDAHRRRCDVVVVAARLSSGILRVFPCRKEEGPAVPVGDYSAVGELPGASVRMEDNPGQRWS